MGNNIRKTNEQFIERAKLIHGDKFDYSKVEYVKASEKIIIICEVHGEFTQVANNHLSGNGCASCALENRKRISNFDYIKSCEEVHSNFYDLTKIEYLKNDDYVTPICKKHGLFSILAGNFKKGFGCRDCGRNKPYTNESFIERANKVHDDFYNYEKIDLKNSSSKVTIICPNHGEFSQNAYSHLIGTKCRKCSWDKRLKIKYESNGWGCNLWQEKANISNSFDSFKLYIIYCFNTEENFYKVGRTFKTLSERFKSLPYNYKVIATIVGTDSCEIVEKESNIKNKIKINRYRPEIKFDGYSECFKIENISDIIYEYGFEKV